MKSLNWGELSRPRSIVPPATPEQKAQAAEMHEALLQQRAAYEKSFADHPERDPAFKLLTTTDE